MVSLLSLKDSYGEYIVANISGYEVLLDKCDEHILNRYWRVVVDKRNGYKRVISSIRIGNGKRKMITMSRFILNVTDKNIKVDHIDGNTLNNRRHNIRKCTNQQNRSEEHTSELQSLLIVHLVSLLLFYRVTKAFEDGSESWQQYGKGYGLDAEIMEAFNRAYTINADDRCSAISVGLCSDEELNMLPRTLLIAAERDILRDQGLNLAERMCGKIQRIEYKGAVHLFITVPGQDTAFDRAVKDAIGFICNK